MPGPGAICKKTVSGAETAVRYTARRMTDSRPSLVSFFQPPPPQTTAFVSLLGQLDNGLADDWTPESLEQAWAAAPNVIGLLLVLLHAADRVALLRGLSACVRGALAYAPAADEEPIAALDAIDAFLTDDTAADAVTQHTAAIADLTWRASSPLSFAACAVDHVCRAVAEPAPSTDAIECVVVASHEYVRAARPYPDADGRILQTRALRIAILDAVHGAVRCPPLEALRHKTDLQLAREYDHILSQL